MTRPEIIRADSIDLQDRTGPSAQDHTHSTSAGVGSHQTETLRGVAAEAADQHTRSPRVSREWSTGEIQGLSQHDDGGHLAAAVTASLADANHHQQDDLAVAQNGGLTGSTAEDAEMADAEGDDGQDDEDDDLMDKISSSPSIDDEDIDFEFVYALHTFVATVEGQANATKGDTMVLLDDSNSYWWLVRVVKDSSIGYLPAEHIETPTERLARLNKHRNIDLTSTMLGDQADKPKNALKKAILRRAAKTVTFAAPTYVEASDVDYSTDEEEAEDDYYGANGQQEQNGDQKEQEVDDETLVVEPLKPRAEVRDVNQDTTEDSIDASKDSSDTARTSDEIFDGKLESSKSRIGTVRNTDSFFKDDSVETRKITLTPNLLRDDGNSSPRTSNESSKELKSRPSLDKSDKESVLDKKEKKDRRDKKEKDKKPGMLSGLFKRKDKKSRSQDDEGEDGLTKQLTENSGESPFDDVNSLEEAQPEIQRQPSKLQKQPRTETSPTRSRSAQAQNKETRTLEPLQIPAPDRPAPVEFAQEPSMRLVQAEETPVEEVQQTRSVPADTSGSVQSILSSPKEMAAGAISKILRSSSTSDPKPIKAKKAKSRVELDDFDSSEEVSPIEESDEESSMQHRPIPGSFPDSYTGSSDGRVKDMPERLAESPVEVSPLTPTQSYPPPLMVDSSSQEDPPSPMSWTSPEPNEADDAPEKKAASSTTSTSTAAWSDTHLRTFFDDGSDIKDLLVVVYDKSGVVPAGPDHPITGNLFKAENAKLADITNRLDGMLGDWLARKMRTQASR